MPDQPDLDPIRFPSRRVIRLPGHDYAQGLYFLTFCTKHRHPVLSVVRDGRVVLGDVGRMVEEEWRRTAELRPGVRLDAFVLMPDHVHAIIGLDGAAGGRDVDGFPGSAGSRAAAGRPYRGRGGGAHLGAVVAGFKSATTRRYRIMAGRADAVLWDRGYFERIIRGARQLAATRRYIARNPARWRR